MILLRGHSRPHINMLTLTTTHIAALVTASITTVSMVTLSMVMPGTCMLSA